MTVEPSTLDAGANRANAHNVKRASMIDLVAIVSEAEGKPIGGRAIRACLERYGVEQGPDRKWDVAAVFDARRRTLAAKKADGSSPNRDRKTALECELLEVRIAALRGEYRSEAQAEAESAAVEFATRIRSAFRGVAQKVAPMVAGTPADIPRCARVIGDEVDAVLNQLADDAPADPELPPVTWRPG